MHFHFKSHYRKLKYWHDHYNIIAHILNKNIVINTSPMSLKPQVNFLSLMKIHTWLHILSDTARQLIYLIYIYMTQYITKPIFQKLSQLTTVWCAVLCTVKYGLYCAAQYKPYYSVHSTALLQQNFEHFIVKL